MMVTHGYHYNQQPITGTFGIVSLANVAHVSLDVFSFERPRLSWIHVSQRNKTHKRYLCAVIDIAAVQVVVIATGKVNLRLSKVKLCH